MGFVGICRALYDYTPQTSGELQISEGDLLLIIEKSTEDDWWRAKKKAENIDADEPEGLIPNNYVEEAHAISHVRALYDYNRQTDEELSFSEHSRLQVYDTSDPDWTLVGLDNEFGFVPANYIEDDTSSPPPMPSRPRAADNEHSNNYPSPAASPVQSPAAALAGIIQKKSDPSSSSAFRSAPSPAGAQFAPEASDEEAAPSLPQRPQSQRLASPPEPPGVMASPNLDTYEGSGSMSPGFHLYHIHEMISHLGRNRKMPTTLGINVPRGIIMIAPEKSKDGPSEEWSAEKLENYAIEGKHVFMELKRPSKSIDLHAGSKDTAKEIVAALGDLAGAARGEGFREVVAASAPLGSKKGYMLFEYMALDDEEITVAEGDEVIVLDDVQSNDWWKVRRLKNGKEGAVPASYVEVTGTTTAAPAINNQSTVDQNRAEEDRLAREALASSNKSHERGKRGSKGSNKSSGSKPESSRVRTWTDRSGSFKVDAQFIGLKDGKIHLHKVNGVKIAVAINKMSVEDVEFVERATGQSLDEDKPLSDIKKKGTQKNESQSGVTPPASSAGAAVQPNQTPEYDWFDFFLQCGVNPQICERYASAFTKDQMGEESMQDIDPHLLRTLGVKEGDILRVMKFLDNKYGRTRTQSVAASGEMDVGDSGLFSGPGGALKNNTRKGRPAPAVQSNATVDPRAFEQNSLKKDVPLDAAPTPLTSVSAPSGHAESGFDDDAWNVKPARTETPVPVATTQKSVPPTGAMSELSLLSPPLQPEPAPPPKPPQNQQPQTSQATGADPSFFDKLAQSTGQASASRQRPVAPQQTQNQNSFLSATPQQRPGSVPQSQGGFSAPPPLPGQQQPMQNLSSLAPPGQSINEINQQRTQQQQQQFMYPQQTGYPNGMMPQPTGFPQYVQQPGGFGQFPSGFQPSVQQQYLNGQQQGSPFADSMQVQQTGYQTMQPQQTGINSFLPPALQPQRTGMNGYQLNGGFGQNFGQNGYGGHQQQIPPVPPIPQQQQQQTPAPLQPQKTGPAPPVRFGVSGGEKKLVPQPTGRANLSKATPQNPFGF